MKQKLSFVVLTSLVFLFSVFIYTPASAQTTATTEAELNALIAHLTRTSPETVKQYEAEKKEFEKWEKDLGKTADNLTQSHMDAVFGKGKLKSSDVLGLLKASEAVLAGDYKKAGEALTDVLISCPPSPFGCYVKAMQKVMEEMRTQISTQIKRWEDEVYQTQSYKYFKYDFQNLTTFNEMIRGRSDYREYQDYVPSYMVSYLRNDPNIGTEMKALYDEMVKREQLILKTWSGAGGRVIPGASQEKGFDETINREAAFNVLLYGIAWLEGPQKLPWWQFASTGDIAAKWRSRIGFAPGEKKGQSADKAIFNHFLYIVTEPKREDYMYDLTEYYIKPIILRNAKELEKQTDAAITEALEQAAIEMRNASGLAAIETKEAEYRKYLDDGLVAGTILLPAGINPDTAHAMGMQAVAGNNSYRSMIASLHARALKETADLAAKLNAQNAINSSPKPKEEAAIIPSSDTPTVTDIAGNMPVEIPPVGIGANLNPDKFIPVRTSLVGPARRQCLMSYDFSGHENADTLALLPEYLQSDSLGYLTVENGGVEELEFLLNLARDVCYANIDEFIDVPEPEAPVDEWGDVDEIDDIIVSNLTEEEKWAKRDALAAKADQDAARSEDRFNRQYASVEARRAEEARIAKEKAAERAEAFAAIAQGLTAISTQIQDADRQSEEASRQNAQAYDTSGLVRASQDRAKFINSCVQSKATRPGFPSLDPTGDRLACGQEYNATKNGTQASGDSYAEKLKRQQQQTAQRRADEASQLAQEKRDSSKAARDRAYAKKQCGCYQAGKRSGAKAPRNEALGYNMHLTDPRPENCLRSTMGDTKPWRLGLFDGWMGETDKRAEKICRFGT